MAKILVAVNRAPDRGRQPSCCCWCIRLTSIITAGVLAVLAILYLLTFLHGDSLRSTLSNTIITLAVILVVKAIIYFLVKDYRANQPVELDMVMVDEDDIAGLEVRHRIKLCRVSTNHYQTKRP